MRSFNPRGTARRVIDQELKRSGKQLTPAQYQKNLKFIQRHLLKMGLTTMYEKKCDRCEHTWRSKHPEGDVFQCPHCYLMGEHTPLKA